MVGGLCAALVLALVSAPAAPAVSEESAGLPLGDPTLVETRETTVLADGVTLTRIVRGRRYARAREIQTTTRGPWRVNVLEIDPAVAAGTLRSTYGYDLARVEKVTAMAPTAGALAAVNASFFAFTASALYPGDPVGLGIYGGELLSEPTASGAEVSALLDARDGTIRMDRFTWRGATVNRRTGLVLPLEHLNHPPVVPAGCRKLRRPTRCSKPGDTVHLSPRFSRATPSGRGVEAVLDARGCLVRRAMRRGTILKPRQTALQATGRETRRLWRLTESGCLDRRVELVASDGEPVELGPWLSGVNGRWRLTSRGVNVVPHRPRDPFFARHPRTFIGRSETGTVLLVTVDGRRSSSVGTTLGETADVALALGMRDAINLDGGGSTTMVAAGEMVSTPSGSGERAVGDALVFVPGP
ncbi:MAG: phosphodiester glycosidase family protein [Actinomycetes bacterium]